jgi:hypothetical protein
MIGSHYKKKTEVFLVILIGSGYPSLNPSCWIAQKKSTPSLYIGQLSLTSCCVAGLRKRFYLSKICKDEMVVADLFLSVQEFLSSKGCK